MSGSRNDDSDDDTPYNDGTKGEQYRTYERLMEVYRRSVHKASATSHARRRNARVPITIGTVVLCSLFRGTGLHSTCPDDLSLRLPHMHRMRPRHDHGHNTTTDDYDDAMTNESALQQADGG